MRAVRRLGGWAVRAAVMAALLTAKPPNRLSAQDTSRISEAQSVLSQLVESYGVSGSEAPVRATVQRLLPSWVKSETDTAGNLWVRVGQGDGPVVIVAHMDEIGFRVDTINADGTLGQTITMPKQYVRLAGTRATGRSFDDRMGCASLILALRRLDRSKLKHPVIFIFSTREEIGLEGAEAAARQLGTSTRRVHAIDTFVSADSPLELQNFALARVGAGAVARALDNSSITPPAYVDSLAQLARARGIALQIGTTNGGNDGSTFTQFGVVDVAMGWPLRYSHSPAEVVDLKDLLSLTDMVRAVAEDW